MGEVRESERRWAAAFENVPREHGFEPLRVQGTLPPALRGTLYRNGPGLITLLGQRYAHWFDGDGAVSAVRFADGAASGAVRVLETAGLAEERAREKPYFGAYGTKAPGLWNPVRSFRVARGTSKNPANTSVLAWAGRLLALCEIGRPFEVDPVPLAAGHNREALRNVLEEIRSVVDLPAQPPQPIPGSMTFQLGTPGTETNIEASFADIEAALFRTTMRQARLVIEPREPERPNMNLLARLLVNRLQVYEQDTGGMAGIFIMDLTTGAEININSGEPVSAIDLMKIPIVLETYRTLNQLPTLSQRQLISDTLVTNPEHTSANELLALIGTGSDPVAGAAQVTATMQRLGLVNTFIMAPYDVGLPAGLRTPETPANTVEVLRANPSPIMQTTAEEIGTLLSMIYYCATGQGGALPAAFPGDDWQRECLEILDYMQQNKIGSLLEEGVPTEINVAHRHGWTGDTNVDAGIVFSPGGDYVLVEVLYKPEWLEWELSAPLMADVSRATYNYFNLDTPHLEETSAANN